MLAGIAALTVALPARAQIETADEAAQATNAPVIDLVARDNRTCARLRDGRWACWGEALLGTGHGTCGDERSAAACDPLPIVSYGAEFRYLVPKTSGCAVAQAGAVACWGTWGDGSARLTNVASAAEARVIGLADDRLCVGTSDNHVRCRRQKGAWQTLPYDDVVRLGVSDSRVGLVRHGHALTLVEYARGTDVSRVRDIGLATRTIGFGSDAAYIVTRDWQGFAIPDGKDPVGLPGLGSAVHIGADPAARHVCATDTAGTVRCSGQNQAGQLGLGDTAPRQSFTPVPSITNAQRIAVGALHSCALTTKGEVYCWGANHVGQLGVVLAEPESKITSRKGRQKGTFTRANITVTPRASLCAVDKQIAATPVRCALEPVRVTFP